MLPRLNVNHHMKWYSRQTNRWSYRPGLPFISIEIGSTSKLDSSAHSIRLLLDSLDFFIFLIFSIHLLLNSCFLYRSSYWFSNRILIHLHHLSIFFLILKISWLIGIKGWGSHVLWTFLLFPLQKYFLQKFLKFFSAAATLHFKWLLHFKEPYCVGEKMSLI